MIFLSPFPIGNVRKPRGVNPNFRDKIAISIFESEFQFPNPNFSNKIAISIFESEFQFPNPNFSNKIAVSIVESEFQFSNPNFNNKIAVSIIESEFQFSNPSFRPPNVLGRTPACLEYTLLHAIGTRPPTDITPNPIHTSYSLIKHSTSLIIGRLLEAHNMIEIFVWILCPTGTWIRANAVGVWRADHWAMITCLLKSSNNQKITLCKRYFAPYYCHPLAST